MELCKNKLVIRGTPVALYLFLKNETVNGEWSLENSIPIPDEVNKNLTAYHNWVHENWGTEWIINSKIDSSRLKYGFITIEYDTEDTGICKSAFEFLQKKYESRLSFSNVSENVVTKDQEVNESVFSNTKISSYRHYQSFRGGMYCRVVGEAYA
jgi:hypothetical protein